MSATIVDESIPKMRALEQKYAKYGDNPPPAVAKVAEREFEEPSKGLPTFDPYKDAAAQNAQQPCYLRSGAPSTDPKTPCPKTDRRQRELIVWQVDPYRPAQS